MSSRVAVIGLDGMAWHILGRLFEYGAMPALRSITENSLRGVLMSTVPPTTPPAWTSIASGVNPGKHGVFDFTALTEKHEYRLLTSRDVRYPRIHEMVALRGSKSICINQPFTYPITRLKNIMVVTDWLGPRVLYYPRSLEKYKGRYKTYAKSQRIFKDRREFLPLLDEGTRSRVDAVNDIMEEMDWDLFWVVFEEPDQLLHSSYDAILSGGETELGIMKKLDETIEKASRLSDLLVIVSDHGFSEFTHTVYINRFLDELGLIAKTRGERIKSRTQLLGKKTDSRYLPVPERMYKLVSRKPVKTLLKRTYNLFTGKDLRAKLPKVDPRRSKAFMPFQSTSGVHVKEESLLPDLKHKLGELKGVKKVWTRGEFYSGPYVSKAPHLVFTYDDNHTGSAEISRAMDDTKVSHKHHPEGILIISGKGVENRDIGNVDTFDLVPTILNYMTLPSPMNTDGKHIQGVPARETMPRTFNYLNRWRLAKKIHSMRRRLLGGRQPAR